MNECKDNLLIRVLKWLGIIVEKEISKQEMCENAKSICNKRCSDCAWGMKDE